jgi:hypothetical protein
MIIFWVYIPPDQSKCYQKQYPLHGLFLNSTKKIKLIMTLFPPTCVLNSWRQHHTVIEIPSNITDCLWMHIKKLASSMNQTDQLVFVTEKHCVFSAVQTEFFNNV